MLKHDAMAAGVWNGNGSRRTKGKEVGRVEGGVFVTVEPKVEAKEETKVESPQKKRGRPSRVNQ